jgi:hypothetical protein
LTNTERNKEEEVSRHKGDSGGKREGSEMVRTRERRCRKNEAQVSRQRITRRVADEEGASSDTVLLRYSLSTAGNYE